MIRLFVALIIPEKIISEIFHHCYAASGNHSIYSWEEKSKVHLTLKFVGEVREDLLQPIIDELEFVESYSGFNCEINRFGFFFKDKQPRILWCNLETDESIFEIVEALNTRLSKFGIEAERRKFKGHLTLMRIKKRLGNDFIKRFEDLKFDPINFSANKVALIQSILKPAGSEYKVLNIYELK